MEEKKSNPQPEEFAPGKASGEGDCYAVDLSTFKINPISCDGWVVQPPVEKFLVEVSTKYNNLVDYLGDQMIDIGKAMAGNSLIEDRENPVMPDKYQTPFSEMIKGMVNSAKKGELSTKDWNKAVILLAYDRLNIKECSRCKHPYVAGWRCSNCGASNPDV